MATGLVILIFLLNALASLAGEHTPRPGFYLALLAALVVVCFAMFGVIESRLEKTGRSRHIVRAERLLSFSRSAVVGVHAYGVFTLGWVRATGDWTGRTPLLHDLASAGPALIALVLIYAAYAPIQRRLREALLWRFLHDGRPIGRALTRWQLVWEHVRHSILLAVVPLLLLRIWLETGSALLRSWDVHGAALAWGEQGWMIVGVFVVLAVSPWLLRFVWDTVPLEGGELRDRVERVLARNRVRARDVLVWQTSSGLLNGALMGVIPMARYVLFTDALLQLLPVRQVEAVAAHETGHARLRHLPWLMGAMMSSALLCGFGIAVLAEHLGMGPSATTEGMVAGGSVLGAVLALGFISRRFELQADAFAVADLSRHPAPAVLPETGNDATPPTLPSSAVTAESAAAMNAALAAVADLNGVPINRFTWRHGTIAGRQRHLESLVGVPLSRLPIDRTVRWIKALTALAALLTVAMLVVLGVTQQ